jgi:hypothetical protein
MLYGRISLGLDLVLEGRVAGFSRHIDAVAVHVELPAVIDATQPTFFIATKEHPRPAMWAERIDDTDRTMAVAEGHQVFTEHAQPHRCPIRFGQFLGHQHRVPEAAEQLAHRCSRTRLGQEFVVAQPQHSTPPMTPRILCCAMASRRPKGHQRQTLKSPVRDEAHLPVTNLLQVMRRCMLRDSISFHPIAIPETRERLLVFGSPP